MVDLGNFTLLNEKSSVKADVDDLESHYGNDQLTWLFGEEDGMNRESERDQ